MTKRVVVAMSGGVDSSVASALLKDRGFEVIGITMQMWEHPGFTEHSRMEDARRVAKKLGIPHHVVDLRDVFEERIIANFCSEYQQGRTPNPCIRCNQYIKFDCLLKKAGELDADYVATGHYARIEYDRSNNRYLLKKGIDVQKDQSYFLYTMTQLQLKSTLMPLGSFAKKRVRQMAEELALPAAGKSESQEVCFVPDNDYGEFLKEYTSESISPGPIMNREGKVIGEHRGIIFYTVGQRKGIGVSGREPLYVIAIDGGKNTIVVGKREEVYSNRLRAVSMNCIAMERLREPLKVNAMVRYSHEPSDAVVSPLDGEGVRVEFSEPQWAITPGQAVVFYDGDVLVGGGKISEVET